MPRRAPRICPRCHGTYQGRRCETCAVRRLVRDDGVRKTPYDSTRWRRESKQFLGEHPLCECPQCSVEPEYLRDIATEVDHIDGLGIKGPRGWDWSNWQGLSKRHHSRKTASQDGGFGNRRIYPNAPAPF